MKRFFLLAAGGLAFSSHAQQPVAVARLLNPAGVAPANGYSHVAQIDLGTGTMLLLSGQIALDATGRLVGPGNLKQQTEQVFSNIRRLVEAGGGNMGHVVKLTYYLTDISQIPVVREVRDRFVNVAAPPASTAVQVSQLVRNDLLIEIEATAIIPRK